MSPSPKLILLISCLHLVTAETIESKFLQSVQQNLTDFHGLNSFYRSLLQDTRSHRSVDTVVSPINLTKIRSNDYDEEYLKNSCYESTSDLLFAHGYNRTDLHLSPQDVQSLLPSLLYSVENPGCERQPPPAKVYSFFDVWVVGFILIGAIKLIHLLTFSVVGHHCLSLTSAGLANTMSDEPDQTRHHRSVSLKYRLWLGLGFNAFTCGLMLGIIIYHLIPHIYDVPNEDFDYTYLLRATVIFFGIYLFFIVEKLLRFRFKIDEEQLNESTTDDGEVGKDADTSMMQMAKICGSSHVRGEGEHRKHSSNPARISLQIEPDDDELNKLNVESKSSTESPAHTDHHHHEELPHKKRNLILYHAINDFSNDLIYGCGFAAAMSEDRLIGLLLCLMIFSEGFRRHSQTISQLGRRFGLYFMLLSILFLTIGYALGAYLIQYSRQNANAPVFIRTEYIYSVVYGALFYTALVSLIPELNDFGHHLQVTLRQINQTPKQRRLIKLFILICQNLFLLIGLIIALTLAAIWRYYHRVHIYEYVCSRDSSRYFCSHR